MRGPTHIKFPGINPAVTMLYELLFDVQKGLPPPQIVHELENLLAFYPLDTLHFPFN